MGGCSIQIVAVHGFAGWGLVLRLPGVGIALKKDACRIYCISLAPRGAKRGEGRRTVRAMALSEGACTRVHRANCARGFLWHGVW